MYQDEGWAQTDLRTPIALYASGTLEKLARPIILIGGVHGDEPLGVSTGKKDTRALAKRARNACGAMDRNSVLQSRWFQK